MEQSLKSAAAVPARAAKGFKPYDAQLALLVDKAPDGSEWLHEIKFDGYRVLGHRNNGVTSFLTRNHKDWTDKFSIFSADLLKLPCKEVLLDGEVVVLNATGKSEFSALQETLSEGREEQLQYFVFDLLMLDGKDLRKLPLLERKEMLRKLLKAKKLSRVHFSDHVRGQGPEFFQKACQLTLEGIISKRVDAPYIGNRNGSWLKVKCTNRQELVICGYSDPKGSREALGALILGYYNEQGELAYAGRVGTGFNARLLNDLAKKLKPLEVPQSPFKETLGWKERKEAHWVKPQLVAEVEFTEWTQDGHLRHPVFQGLRQDKQAREVRRELPKTPVTMEGVQEVLKGKRNPPAKTASKPSVKTASTKDKNAVEVAGVRISHPDKLLFAEEKISKLDLARYYEKVAPRMLPLVAGRPLMIVRCPDGRGKECFFQKNWNENMPAALRRIRAKNDGKAENFFTVDSVQGLIHLVQLGALEIHMWNTHASNVEQPDQVVFDLDPDPSVGWEEVLNAARAIEKRLTKKGFKNFIKTTGGKGLHVVMPFKPEKGWDEVKAATRELAESFVRERPSEFIATLSKAKRVGKIFIDYLRNGRGATAIAPYSARAREGAPVAMPIRFSDLTKGVRGNSFTVRDVLDPGSKILGKADPWADFPKVKQKLKLPL